MRRFLYIIIGIITTTSGVNGQAGYHSIHQFQHNKYKNQTFQQEVPSLAKGHIPLQRSDVDLNKVIYGFHPYWKGTDWQNYNYDLLTHIAYFGVDINSDGSLENTHGWPVISLINTAHDNGVKVLLVAVLFNSSGIETLLNNETYQQNLIDNLVEAVQNAGADGVNIDFEGMPDGQRSNFVTFMQNLTAEFHSEIPESHVSIDMPAINWSDRFNVGGLANACDALMIMGYNYHWGGSPNTGPVSPLTGSGYNVTNTLSYYLSNTDRQRDKLILGLPYYGKEWPAEGPEPGASTTGEGVSRVYEVAEPLAQTYGKLRSSEYGEIPWYRYKSGDEWKQGWYDDSLSLSLKYQLALQEDVQGIGIWALGYDGSRTELWGALEDHFTADSIPPPTPDGFFVKRFSRGIAVDVGIERSERTRRYRLYTSNDGVNFSLFEEFVDPKQTYTEFPEDTVVYFRITAVNEAGESQPTEVLGTVPGPETPRVLVVNGFDRTSGTTNTRDFIRQHGGAIWGNGVYFDAASNESVRSGDINLTGYEVVDWFLGEEGTTTHTFDSTEQVLVMEFLENGGKLLVSGSEIGYDLVANGSTEDQSFYENYLKAEYISDAAGSPLSFFGEGPVFGDLGTVNFDDGTHGTYHVDYPDGIHPVEGAEVVLKYEGSDYDTQGGAGIAYTGSFSLGSPEGKLVYISPGFETIYPVQAQLNVMNRILTYFEIPTDIDNGDVPVPATFDLLSAYPNPFNATITIQYHLRQSAQGNIQIDVYDLLGRRVQTLLDGRIIERKEAVQWNGRDSYGNAVATGTYLVVAQHNTNRKTLKVTLLK